MRAQAPSSKNTHESSSVKYLQKSIIRVQSIHLLITINYMFQKLKQYKDLRDSAKDAQNVLSQETVHADSVGGKINIIIDGNQKIVSLDIDTSLLAPENKEKVEKGVKEAIESANKKLQRVMLKKIQSGELKMPDLPGVIGQ